MTRILLFILFCGLCNNLVWAQHTESPDPVSTKYEVLVVVNDIIEGFSEFDAVIESEGVDPLQRTFEAPYLLRVSAEEFSANITRLTGAGEVRVIVRVNGSMSGEEYSIAGEGIKVCAAAQDEKITISQCEG